MELPMYLEYLELEESPVDRGRFYLRLHLLDTWWPGVGELLVMVLEHELEVARYRNVADPLGPPICSQRVQLYAHAIVHVRWTLVRE